MALKGLEGHTVYLDTNIVIYALEGFAPYRPILLELLENLDQGVIRGVTSELTLAEVLVKPFRDGNQDRIDAYESFLFGRENLRVVPVTRDVLVKAATLRASSGIRLPDAIHLATAMIHGCDAFLTNDLGLGVAPAGLMIFPFSRLV